MTNTINNDDFESAKNIRLCERDQRLALGDSSWPPQVEGWTTQRDHLSRRVTGPEISVSLWEGMFRFPSAPIHGLHRLHEYQYNLDHSENFHTLRVLAADQEPQSPPTHIYLFQNGLNEYDNQGLYYRIASEILRSEPQAVCILRPFPGHLTRFPFQAFSELPLDLFLSDGSILFRQFLRYMVETQWLLSVLSCRAQYQTPSGCVLLAPSNRREESRLSPEILSRSIHDDWKNQYRSSTGSFPKRTVHQGGAPKLRKPATLRSVRASVNALRRILRWDDYAKATTELPDPDITDGELPHVSVIGYSLGGFVAQSIFMAWPFAITGCSTLLSGGALRDLAPTAFAHPEEWQTVLHSLRYELDNSMSNGFFKPNTGRSQSWRRVAGVDERFFLSMQRVFYEIFAQDYRGSYRTRVSEHGERMLFVLGGDDPIVRPRSVLDAAPTEGVNMVEVARLRHFIGTPTSDTRENEQRDFWIPQIARLIHEFVCHAGKLHHKQLLEGWITDVPFRDAGVGLAATDFPRNPFDAGGEPPELKPLNEAEKVSIPTGGDLPSELFGRSIDDLLASTRQQGYLFIMRNTVPVVLLPDELVLWHGQALFHQDSAIRNYLTSIRARRKVIEASAGRLSILLPLNARDIFLNQDPEHGFPTQGETPVGALPMCLDRAIHWESVGLGLEHLKSRAPSSVRHFAAGDAQVPGALDAAPGDKQGMRDLVAVAAKQVRSSDDSLFATALPDAWIWLNGKYAKNHQLDEAATALYRLAVRWKEHPGLEEALQSGDVRVLSVSRSRLNPRYCGRRMLDTRRAANVVIHAALCLAMSRPYAGSVADGDAPE